MSDERIPAQGSELVGRPQMLRQSKVAAEASQPVALSHAPTGLSWHVIQDATRWRWEARMEFSERPLAQSWATFATPDAAEDAMRRFGAMVGLSLA